MNRQDKVQIFYVRIFYGGLDFEDSWYVGSDCDLFDGE
jgi:hypothetical protein